MALTKRYVRADADGTGDGTTDANSGATGAFTIEQMITDINTPHAAYKYLVKAGTYARTTSSVTLTGDGTPTSPIVIEGFNTTEGDLYAQGRSSGGALDTTNFPEITFTTGFLNANGANYLVIACIKLSGAPANAVLVATSRFQGRRLHVTNTNSSSASGTGISLGSIESTLIDCDVLTTSGGGTNAIRSLSSNNVISGCRAKCPAGTGILIRSSTTVRGCTIYECGTHGVATDNVPSNPIIMDNTIVNCSSNGIDIIASSTAIHVITGNHITGCGGYGIEFNASTCVKTLGWNRFRDNTSGNINGTDDWTEDTICIQITSDDSDADDFTDQTTDDYSLKSTAAGHFKNIGYLKNIGANGTPAATSGGGSALHLGGLGQTGIGVF